MNVDGLQYRYLVPVCGTAIILFIVVDRTKQLSMTIEPRVNILKSEKRSKNLVWNITVCRLPTFYQCYLMATS